MSILVQAVALLALPVLAAAGDVPDDWQPYRLKGTSFECRLPQGWSPQIAYPKIVALNAGPDTHPGAWNLLEDYGDKAVTGITMQLDGGTISMKDYRNGNKRYESVDFLVKDILDPGNVLYSPYQGVLLSKRSKIEGHHVGWLTTLALPGGNMIRLHQAFIIPHEDGFLVLELNALPDKAQRLTQDFFVPFISSVRRLRSPRSGTGPRSGRPG